MKIGIQIIKDSGEVVYHTFAEFDGDQVAVWVPNVGEPIIDDRTDEEIYGLEITKVVGLKNYGRS